jgi:hemerythrin
MKKLVNNRLTHFLEEKGYLPMEQYGFRKNQSTKYVHTILETEIQEKFREKQHFLLVSLDLTKA